MEIATDKCSTGGDCLDFDAAVRARRSVRAFRPEPVARELLEHVFELANHAPSNCNTQPWHTVIASGAACERLRQKFQQSLAQGQYAMDFPYEGRYAGVFRERQFDAAERLYGAMGIAREDKAARGTAFMRNFAFFDAPHVVFLFMPEWCGIREAADVGMYAQTLMLGLSAHGLASCPQTALSFNADMVREELGVDASYRLLFGLSLGYEDTAHPANDSRIGRAALGEVLRFVD
ncbi:MAG: nitroreductase family protein [Gammaproteobacteria bacterium]|jgi:nitroreductase|nr:nitroreductase family protein [Gammaproteobacteria bacterium]MBP6051214.1 nitroreductase family protein [Pseudomonadales bacterium]MBK6581560.1 nitroreductase family protein [Gammaproteobacteria bacterium]MBK7170412.1 nitroreductase family protein [Gammaproteobacteria bacterium]MBK7522321.1 nitroreductase family protein [Gammaproteobacteria bacterium]